jgi:hypothetical protein
VNISTGQSALLMQYSRCCARFLADDRTQCARNQIDWPLFGFTRWRTPARH